MLGCRCYRLRAPGKSSSIFTETEPIMSSICSKNVLRARAGRVARRLAGNFAQQHVPRPTAHAGTITSVGIASIDASEYLSGKPRVSFIGKIVSIAVPPPVRFASTWIAPTLCLASLFPHHVISLLATLVLALQVRSSTLLFLLQDALRV
jgi:hypothetical protein